MSDNLIQCENGHMFSARRHGNVCPYCNVKVTTKKEQETGPSEVDVEAMLFQSEVHPVCGWIVCISGPPQGRDYRIRDGKNFVGRADDMDIQIPQDTKISRRNHTVVVFDAKKKETVLLPGDSNGIVYLNEDAVYTPQVLNPYDVVEMGDSKFLFIPFCGESFMWEDKPTAAAEK